MHTQAYNTHTGNKVKEDNVKPPVPHLGSHTHKCKYTNTHTKEGVRRGEQKEEVEKKKDCR